MTRHLTKLSIVAALSVGTMCLASMTARAREWPTTGGWEITEGDDFCVMHSEFEGPGESMLAVLLYLDGRHIVADVNGDWSSEKGKPYDDVTFVVNGEVYSGGAALGIHLFGKKGFAVKVGEDFLPDLAASKNLHIYKGRTIIDRLDLGGSSVGLVTTRRCLAHVRRKVATEKAAEQAASRAAQRERDRYADLPKDPFKPEQ